MLTKSILQSDFRVTSSEMEPWVKNRVPDCIIYALGHFPAKSYPPSRPKLSDFSNLLQIKLPENHYIPLTVSHTHIAYKWKYPPPLILKVILGLRTLAKNGSDVQGFKTRNEPKMSCTHIRAHKCKAMRNGIFVRLQEWKALGSAFKQKLQRCPLGFSYDFETSKIFDTITEALFSSYSVGLYLRQTAFPEMQGRVG